ncbi:Cell differentiation protein RCD1 [Tritrichomonas musculus]|uniref:Cell differentiation protein RCD1 n=1 Tax=Tritrichomonas musculus TaxID=1915356 RepID=A0ABR2H9X6_9EUKA
MFLIEFFISNCEFKFNLQSTMRATSPQWSAGTQMQFIPPYQNQGFQQNQYRQSEVINNVKKLTMSPSDRAEALHTLSAQRESIPELAVLLWESPGTITALLYEILSIYPHLMATSTGSNNAHLSLNVRLATRVCHVLALLQCVAGNDQTRLKFIKANIPMYLFPFLHTTNQSHECECFKLTSLGILGSLVKAEQSEIIKYLLQNEFVPLCLRILKFGQLMSRIVAAFIVQKILSDQEGRNYVCANNERLETVLSVLNIVLNYLAANFNVRLSKNVVQSYKYLLSESNVKEIAAKMNLEKLRKAPLDQVSDEVFVEFVHELLSLNNAGMNTPRTA